MSDPIPIHLHEPAAEQSLLTRDTLTNLVTGMGTSRDKRTAHRFLDGGRTPYGELEAMYRSEWLAAAVVDYIVEVLREHGHEVYNGEPELMYGLATRLCVEVAELVPELADLQANVAPRTALQPRVERGISADPAWVTVVDFDGRRHVVGRYKTESASRAALEGRADG